MKRVAGVKKEGSIRLLRRLMQVFVHNYRKHYLPSKECHSGTQTQLSKHFEVQQRQCRDISTKSTVPSGDSHLLSFDCPPKPLRVSCPGTSSKANLCEESKSRTESMKISHSSTMLRGTEFLPDLFFLLTRVANNLAPELRIENAMGNAHGQTK